MKSIGKLSNGLAFEVEQLLKSSEQFLSILEFLEEQYLDSIGYLPNGLALEGKQHLESLGQLSTGLVLSVEGCVLF